MFRLLALDMSLQQTCTCSLRANVLIDSNRDAAVIPGEERLC